jgi:hypothetical protein
MPITPPRPNFPEEKVMLILNENAQHFVDEITDRLNEGWELVGQHVITHSEKEGVTLFSQMMIFKNK